MKGASEMGKYPMSGRMMMSVCLPDVKYSHPPEEGPLLPIEGWIQTLHPKGRKTKFSQEIRINSQSTRSCSSNERGRVGQPLRHHLVYWVGQASKITPTKCWTVIDSIVNNKRL